MEKKIESIIFDADGVLLLSTEISMDVLIEVIKICELLTPTRALLRELWGKRLEEELLPAVAQKLEWPEGSIQLVRNLFIDTVNVIKYPSQPGLITMFDDLLKRRCRLGIVSNRDTKSLFWRLEQQGLDVGVFDYIQTATPELSKPNPEMFNHFWNGAEFKPETTLFVGDSINYDLKAAQLHSPPLRFAAIISGVNTRQEFLRAGVKLQHMFNKVTDISEMLHCM